MARESKTRYAVLGCLAWRPMSGYDIRKAIEGSLANFWNESFGQIYPALKQLVEDGLATCDVQRTLGKPDRHEYAITEAGRDELRHWLGQPAEPHRYRVEVLVKLLFGHQVGATETLRHVARFRAEHEALLAQFGEVEQQLQREHEGNAELPYWLLTVRCGLGVSAAFVTWCNDAEASLRALADAEKKAPATRPALSRKGGAR